MIAYVNVTCYAVSSAVVLRSFLGVLRVLPRFAESASTWTRALRPPTSAHRLSTPAARRQPDRARRRVAPLLDARGVLVHLGITIHLRLGTGGCPDDYYYDFNRRPGEAGGAPQARSCSECRATPSIPGVPRLAAIPARALQAACAASRAPGRRRLTLFRHPLDLPDMISGHRPGARAACGAS